MNAAAAVESAPARAAVTASAVGTLRVAECWDLLALTGAGRLAVIARDGGPDIFPVNVVVSDRCLYLRSGPGQKLADISRAPAVAFEADGRDGVWQWSVVVRGSAQRLYRDDEIEASGVLGLATAAPGTKHDFVRITPTRVTGRRFRTDVPAPAASGDAAVGREPPGP